MVLYLCLRTLSLFSLAYPTTTSIFLLECLKHLKINSNLTPLIPFFISIWWQWFQWHRIKSSPLNLHFLPHLTSSLPRNPMGLTSKYTHSPNTSHSNGYHSASSTITSCLDHCSHLLRVACFCPCPPSFYFQSSNQIDPLKPQIRWWHPSIPNPMRSSHLTQRKAQLLPMFH